MQHDSECLPGTHHLAVVNLFRESDGKLYLTVAMADGAAIEFQAKKLKGLPIDYVEGLIIQAADTMAARRKPPLDRKALA